MKELKTLFVALAILLATSLLIRGFNLAHEALPCKLGLAKCQPENPVDDAAFEAPLSNSDDFAVLVKNLPEGGYDPIAFDTQFRLEMDGVRSASQVLVRLMQWRENAHEAARRQGLDAPQLDNESADLLNLVPASPNVAPRLVLLREGRTLKMRVKGCTDQLQALRLIKRAIQTEVALTMKHYVENCSRSSNVSAQATPFFHRPSDSFIAKVNLFAKSNRSEDALEVYKDVEMLIRKNEPPNPSHQTPVSQ